MKSQKTSAILPKQSFGVKSVDPELAFEVGLILYFWNAWCAILTLGLVESLEVAHWIIDNNSNNGLVKNSSW